MSGVLGSSAPHDGGIRGEGVGSSFSSGQRSRGASSGRASGRGSNNANHLLNFQSYTPNAGRVRVKGLMYCFDGVILQSDSQGSDYIDQLLGPYAGVRCPVCLRREVRPSGCSWRKSLWLKVRKPVWLAQGKETCMFHGRDIFYNQFICFMHICY